MISRARPRRHAVAVPALLALFLVVLSPWATVAAWAHPYLVQTQPGPGVALRNRRTHTRHHGSGTGSRYTSRASINRTPLSGVLSASSASASKPRRPQATVRSSPNTLYGCQIAGATFEVV